MGKRSVDLAFRTNRDRAAGAAEIDRGVRVGRAVALLTFAEVALALHAGDPSVLRGNLGDVRGVAVATFGPVVLRTETAAIVAAALALREMGFLG